MTRSVAVVAAGAVAFARQLPGSVDTIAAAAVIDALRHGTVGRAASRPTDMNPATIDAATIDAAAIDPATIDEVYVGSAKGGSLVGQRALRYAGLANGLPIYNVENACASSAVAFQLACRSIAAGHSDVALVVGVDQLSSLGRGALPVQDTEWDGANGINNPAIYAMRARRYLHETGAGAEQLAAVSVKARRFAAANPIAQHRTPTTIDEVLASRPVAEPLTLLQCSSKSDGAAAVVVMAADRADAEGRHGPEVLAAEVRSGTFSMRARDITRPEITEHTAAAAYARAGVGPADLDVVELHDAFSIAELLYTEELGLCPRGAGAELLESGASSALTAGGAVVNPSGGLLGRGHPIGATGAAQLVELFRQLTGTAGTRQKEGARVGLAHVTGGGASGFDNGACAVTILRSRT